MSLYREARRPILCLGLGLAATLTAGETPSGFQWLGLRGGTLYFDQSEYAGTTVPIGLQGGFVFDQANRGFSFEGFQYFSHDALLPDTRWRHRGASATYLSALSRDSSGLFWPYVGLGLGALSAPRIDPHTKASTPSRTAEAHLALGFFDRSQGWFIWGMEARPIFRFPLKSLHEIQLSLLFGLNWGRPLSSPSASTPAPPPDSTRTSGFAVPAVPPRRRPILPQANPAPVPPLGSTAVGFAEAVGKPSTPPSGGTASALPAVPAPASGSTPASLSTPAPATAPGPTGAAGLPVPNRPAPGRPEGFGSSAAERVKSLRLGDIPRALALSRSHLDTILAHRWTLRLEVARLTATLQNAPGAFRGATPDLFIAPIRMRDGSTAHQLFLGDYASQAEAERALKTVPAFFLKTWPRPIPILVSNIPAGVCLMARPVPVPPPASTPAPSGIPVRPTSFCTRCH